VSWATATADGTRLLLRVQPRASRSEVVGPHGEALRVRLAAPPVDGAANEELVRLLAERLGVARSAISISAGASGRSKGVRVAGLVPAEVADRLGLEPP
jgi:uncharacterized protein (TIGR00251 family)